MNQKDDPGLTGSEDRKIEKNRRRRREVDLDSARDMEAHLDRMYRFTASTPLSSQKY